MADFTPPPTYAQVVLYDEKTSDIKELVKSAKFNPIWLKWFLDLAALLPGAGAGLGTVTSVAESFTGGLISVGGSPITTSGTLALTVAGTSGGVPYFSSGTVWAASAALAQGGIVVGGGAGNAPSSVVAGATTAVLVGGGANTAPVWTAATGSGAPVRANTPTLITPDIGVATGTSLQTSTPVNSLTTGVAQFKSGSWTPSQTNLTVVGTPTYTGTYTRIADRVMCTLEVDSTVSTASTGNSTTFSGLPYAVAAKDVCMATSESTANLGTGLVFTDDKVYTPTWAATNKITVSFSYRTTANF